MSQTFKNNKEIITAKVFEKNIFVKKFTFIQFCLLFFISFNNGNAMFPTVLIFTHLLSIHNPSLPLTLLVELYLLFNSYIHFKSDIFMSLFLLTKS